MERPLPPFERLVFLALLLLLYRPEPVRLDPTTPGNGGNSLVAQLLGEGSVGEELALREFDEEAYATCRRYLALHDSQKAIGFNLPLQEQTSRESVNIEGGSTGEEDVEPPTGVALSREIRRPSQRSRVFTSRAQGEEGDYGSSTEFTKVVTSKKRSCIRRGGSCDARPSDCCYHSSCRCNLWGTNCRCMRMGILQRWINGRRR